MELFQRSGKTLVCSHPAIWPILDSQGKRFISGFGVWGRSPQEKGVLRVKSKEKKLKKRTYSTSTSFLSKTFLKGWREPSGEIFCLIALVVKILGGRKISPPKIPGEIFRQILWKKTRTLGVSVLDNFNSPIETCKQFVYMFKSALNIIWAMAFEYEAYLTSRNSIFRHRQNHFHQPNNAFSRGLVSELLTLNWSFPFILRCASHCIPCADLRWTAGLN